MLSPVASHDAIRMLIAIAAGDNLVLEGADVSNAYLYGDIDIPIIMEQPTNSTQVPAAPGHVCKLMKSIYGTKQAGEIWGSHPDYIKVDQSGYALSMLREYGMEQLRTYFPPMTKNISWMFMRTRNIVR